MHIGLIGLGKMGFNMMLNLLDHGHQVAAFDLSEPLLDAASTHGAHACKSISELVADLPLPRIIWLMVPAGAPVDQTIHALFLQLQAGDILIDGGNSYYKDSQRLYRQLRENGIHFLDVGTSGGLTGARQGACMMIGGDESAFRQIEPVIRDLCVPEGYGFVGPSGAGHYVKMVHNGIEYGMMQAIGEGLELCQASGLGLDLHQVAAIWSQGSVIRSWLMDLTANALSNDPQLSEVSGIISDSGEGQWTVMEMLDKKVAGSVITEALFRRYRSRTTANYSDKVVAALRYEFGGHALNQEAR